MGGLKNQDSGSLGGGIPFARSRGQNCSTWNNFGRWVEMAELVWVAELLPVEQFCGGGGSKLFHVEQFWRRAGFLTGSIN